METALNALSNRLTDAVNRRAGEAVALLETLVNLDTGSYASAGLNEASVWMEGQLRALGFEVERHTSEAAGPTLIGRKQGEGRHRVLLLAHYDTVFELGEPSRRPFRIDGRRAFGPGVADMKGGVVTVWEALRALGDARWREFGTMTVIHNADEEIGSAAARPFIEDAAREADICLVHEPGRPDGSVVTARKGVGRFVLTTYGKAAHAGNAPQDGASAVVALARKILDVHALNDYRRGLTLNSIVTRGGTRSNVVPDQAEAEIDLRVPTMAMRDEVIGRLEAIAGQESLPGTRATLRGDINRPPLEPAPGSDMLFSVAERAAGTLGITLKATTAGGGSDGNFVSALGVPVLDGLGAVGGAYHSPDEWLDLDSLRTRAAMSALLLVGACREETLLR